MPQPYENLRDTKLRILAIIYNNGVSHGYDIWTTLKEQFHCYLDEQSRRNVYHHLRDLHMLGLIERSSNQTNKNAPTKHPYKLTHEGRTLEPKFRKYLKSLSDKPRS